MHVGGRSDDEEFDLSRQQGAKAIVIVDDPQHRPNVDRFRRWLREPQAEEYGLPVFHVSRDLVQRALAVRLNLATAASEIDRDFAPKSRALPDITLRAVDRTTKVRRPVRNVIGLLTGSDASLHSESVIVGAHYDHLGRSGRYAMSQGSTGQIHHGADDNASGTAAIMRLRLRSWRNCRMRALMCGSPSACLCSSRTSCLVIRICFVKENF